MMSGAGHGHHVRRAVLDYNKLSVMIILGAVLYSEYFAYYSAYSRWPTPPIQQKGQTCPRDWILVLIHKFLGDEVGESVKK